MTNTEKVKAEKILDEAIRKHKNAIDDWKAYERCNTELELWHVYDHDFTQNNYVYGKLWCCEIKSIVI